MLHSRRVRIENAEKQQAIALERMQRMVEDNDQQQKERLSVDKENDASNIDMNETKSESFYGDLNNMFDKKPLEEVAIENGEVHDGVTKRAGEENHNDIEHSLDIPNDSILMGAPSAYLKEKDKDHAGVGKTNGTVGTMHGKDIHLTDKDSVMGDGELMLSDIESEGTQPEEVSLSWFYFCKFSLSMRRFFPGRG
jgi:hypothetical protein